MKEHYSTSKTIVARTFKRLDFLGVDGTALFTNILLKKVIKYANDAELAVKRPSGNHTVTRSQSDFQAIVKELHTRAEVFVNKAEEGRQHAAFLKFRRSVLSTLEYDKLNAWINEHKKKWAKYSLLRRHLCHGR